MKKKTESRVPPISRVAMYVRDMPKIAAFYAKHFGFVAVFSKTGDKAILTQPGNGLRIVLLQASKGHIIGQSVVKLIFDVADVPAYKEHQARLGLKFGTISRGPDYQYCNARDPAKNLVQISDSYLVDDAFG